jgi:hypothetical protein
MPYVPFGLKSDPQTTFSNHYADGTYSNYELKLFSNPDRNLLKSRGELAVGVGVTTGGIMTIMTSGIAGPPTRFLQWWIVPAAFTVAGVVAVAVAEDIAGIVKWS